MKTEYFECACHSDEHTLKFILDLDYPDGKFPEIYISMFLNQHRNIFKRIWIAIKYVLGYKCKYGHWDNWILDLDDTEKMIKMLTEFKEQLEKQGYEFK